MAAISGKQGAIYYQKASLVATASIAFVDSNPDTITDSESRFVSSGFAAQMYITVTNSDLNNGTFQIDTGGVAAGTLTLVAGDTLNTEAAGASTIKEALPGTVMTGFRNWTIDTGQSVATSTDFVASGTGYGAKTSIIKNWTATAEQYWQTDQAFDWVGNSVTVRFFTVYTTAPNTTTNFYYEGTAVVSGIDTTVPADELIMQNLTFEGSGALTLTTRSTAWPT